MARLTLLLDPEFDPFDPGSDPLVDLGLTLRFDLVSDLDVDLVQTFVLAKEVISGTTDVRGNTRSTTDTVTPPIPPAAKSDPLFDRFWLTYPRRVKKAGARSSWVRVTRTVDPEVVIAGAERYRDDPNREKEFTLHPTTWLNQGCWEDEPLPARTNGRPAVPEPMSLTRRLQIERQLEGDSVSDSPPPDPERVGKLAEIRNGRGI